MPRVSPLGQVERQLGLVDDALHARARAAALAPRLGVAAAEGLGPLGARVGGGDRGDRGGSSWLETALAVSIALPPPSATSPSAPASCAAAAAARTPCTAAWGCTPAKRRSTGRSRSRPALGGDEQRPLDGELGQHARAASRGPSGRSRAPVSRTPSGLTPSRTSVQMANAALRRSKPTSVEVPVALSESPTRPLPPGVSEAELSRALDAFAAALGAERVLTSEARTCTSSATRSPSRPGTTTRPPPWSMPETVEEVQAVVRIANEHRVPLWTHGTGRNNGYGGPAPRVQGLGDREPAAHEPRPGDQRGAGLRGGGAGRALVRPLRGHPGRRPPAHALHRRPGLGRRGGKHARPRGHLHAARRGHGGAVRDGGGAGGRRGHADRDGRAARQPGVARLQARAGADARPALHAVQLRDRHQDGLLADALPRGLHAAVAAGVEGRRPRAGPGHAARAHARRDDPHGAQVINTVLMGSVLLERAQWWQEPGPDPRRGHREDGQASWTSGAG